MLGSIFFDCFPSHKSVCLVIKGNSWKHKHPLRQIVYRKPQCTCKHMYLDVCTHTHAHAQTLYIGLMVLINSPPQQLTDFILSYTQSFRRCRMVQRSAEENSLIVVVDLSPPSFHPVSSCLLSFAVNFTNSVIESISHLTSDSIQNTKFQEAH